VLLILAAPAIVFVAALTFALWRAMRHHDSAVNRALAKANAGDVTGAMDDLQEQIRTGGMTATRAIALGGLHFLKDEWDDAERLFDEAERLGYDKRSCTMNRAMIRYKTGHPEEALPVLQELHAANPDETVLGCNVCHVLIDLGQVEEARRLFADVESRHKKTMYLGAASRQQIESVVQECRARLEGKPKTDLSALDEL
jgi:tetratricopeptide (TPR) repeat protein